MHFHHSHGSNCGCTAHRVGAGWGERLAVLLPFVTCAVCPACLSLYAKVFATLGVGVALTETQHTGLLGVAVAVSLGVSALRSWRSGRLWPLALALPGCGLLVLGHAGEARWLEWSGILVLLVGGLREQRHLRRAEAAAVRGVLRRGGAEA